jgi:hypothetical protein
MNDLMVPSCYPQFFSLQLKYFSAPFAFLSIVASPHSHESFTHTHDRDDNEPLGAKGPPLVGEEVCKDDIGQVRN